MADLAMFPLGSVLFPHMPLALRVFEERYLVMLARLLDTEDPRFGVVLIERGHETGGADQRFRIGTMAHITRLTPRDDHVSLVARGGSRIEVVEWLEDDPHPVALVRELPDFEWDAGLEPLRDEAERIVRRTIARSAEFAEMPWDADVELSDDPIESAWQLAAIAPLGPIDQLALLTSSNATELLTRIAQLTLEAEPALTAPGPDTAFDDALAALLETDADGAEDDPGTDDEPDEPDEGDPPGGSQPGPTGPA
ncbi:LON peptidase substrate-binding domain-containing protein [Microbacterium rhizomatis]|uniref:Peptidase S16 n=1 Tax=Microbacterium rhizomatis TaxID=1631477 RepID=A0A5J5J6X6_9MICO|nr:LON peptidase substrate-binding domain-containing protein [Microbacterium rhizomatis]KAA9110884.1 peptidase S16 [Microbacterium rhizomatis]